MCIEQIHYMSICGWSYPFMVVESSVAEGEEVLYDYGHSYCKNAMPAEPLCMCFKDQLLTATVGLHIMSTVDHWREAETDH